MRSWMTCLVTVLVLGCGSSGGPGGGGSGGSGGMGGTGGSGGSGGCTITISGAATGTVPCQASSLWGASHDRGSVTLVVANPAPLQTVSLDITRPGQVMTGPWANTDAGAVSGIHVVTPGSPGPAWVAAAGTNSQGSYTMNLTAADVLTSTSASKIYSVHGTINATLEPIPGTGSSGTVNFQATF